MLVSRLGDLREQSLIRQGKGWFHVSGMGHEALACIGLQLRQGDMVAGYYRDRPIALGRGFKNRDLALAFFAKEKSKSGGRQMPAHYSDRELGVLSISSVVASGLLPACGLAWGLQLDGKNNVVVATIGDAATREGEFYEAIAFAKERQLPVLFVVEDNGIGISSVTGKSNPLALGIINRDDWRVIDACEVETVHKAAEESIESIRCGGGPRFLWCKTERISSHSSADDQRKYRSAEELELLDQKDPIHRFKQTLIAQGVLTEEAYQELYSSLEAEVRADYQSAANEADPDPDRLMEHILGPSGDTPSLRMSLPNNSRMVDAINGVFHKAVQKSTDYVFFGQDIEDPKGGVFSITKGLSSKAPDQVFNSPLAEATIIGVACGLAAYGKRPVFEIQFTDFIWPGFNQLMTNLSTLHWRSNGEWNAPAVIYAPYGAYLPGGSLWHSQANEAALAHFPGLQIAIPSTPEDAAGLFWTAMHGSSPSIILIPKHLMWKPGDKPAQVMSIPFGKAAIRKEGREVTIVTWGNCTEIVQEALTQLGNVSVEFIDLRSIVPLDLATIENSVRKTGRLVVVHEDAETCSIGQNIISRMMGNPEVFSSMLAAPVLVAKPDVNIGYHPNIEYAALPGKENVVNAVRATLHSQPRNRAATALEQPVQQSYLNNPVMPEKAAETTIEKTPYREIRVPILGEGISNAKVISLLVKPGDTIDEDDALCEVETDKALFPIEAPFSGVMQEWLVSEGDEVAVDQLIGRVVSDADFHVPVPQRPTHASAPVTPVYRPSEGGLPPHIVAQMRNTVPAHMTVKASWTAIRNARARAKKALGAQAPSPTVMVAWSLVQAMKKHRVFACTITPGDTLMQHENFDFGVAVSLDNDALDTAIIEGANALTWEDFQAAYDDAVRKVRAGIPSSKACTPLILTSMGGFNVRDALPVVVPPAIGTLFIGEAHWEAGTNGSSDEKVNLCLTFDHRWMNGVAGAQFLSDVRREMESFIWTN